MVVFERLMGWVDGWECVEFEISPVDGQSQVRKIHPGGYCDDADGFSMVVKATVFPEWSE